MAEDNEFSQEGLQAAFEQAKGTVEVVDPPKETPTTETPAPNPAPEIETAEPEYKFNASDWLKTSTEGLIDSEEKFKEFVPKIKNYDSLETKVKELETKIPKYKNDESQRVFELITSSDDYEKQALDYLLEKKKDYATMSDIDVVRQAISKEHPEWDARGIELEVRGKFGKQLEPIDLSTIEEKDEEGKTTQEYRDAVAHNEKAEENLLRLTIAARDARVNLIENQKKIELPQLQKSDPAPTPTTPDPETVRLMTEKWVKDVETEVPAMPPIKYAINDKEVEYSYTKEQAQEFTEYMKTFNINSFAKERKWLNDDGTTNARAISEDVRKILEFEKMVRSFGTQIDTLATKEALKKIKNIPNETPAGGELDTEPGTMEEAYTRARSAAKW